MGHFQQNFHYLSTMGEYWASCCISTGSLLIKAVGVPLKVSSSTSYSVSSPSLSILTPIPLCRSNCPNKGIPPTQPDKDPRLSLGSKPKMTGTGPNTS